MLKIHHNLVRKAWERAGLQPHRFERYMESDDPDFEQKAADVIGLYVNPPDFRSAASHRAVQTSGSEPLLRHGHDAHVQIVSFAEWWRPNEGSSG